MRLFPEHGYCLSVHTCLSEWPHPDSNLLKDSGKAPHASPERIAILEAPFHRVRRLHTTGAFYNLPAAEPDGKESGGAPVPQRHECPQCGGR